MVQLRCPTFFKATKIIARDLSKYRVSDTLNNLIRRTSAMRPKMLSTEIGSNTRDAKSYLTDVPVHRSLI